MNMLSAIFGSGTAGGHETIVWLLIILLTLVSGLISFFTVIYYLRGRRANDNLLAAPPVRNRSLWPGQKRVPFFVLGYLRRWLAIRSRNLEAVQEALRLNNTMLCSWADGIAQATDNKLFIAPPVRGWILVFGHQLPEPSDDIDSCFRFVMELSQEVGEVQFFCADPVTQHHAWIRVVEGQVIRAYAWAEETLWNQGEPSSAERALRMRCYDYGESPVGFVLGAQEVHRSNAEKVYSLAARWSVDPTHITEGEVHTGLGIAGEISRLEAT